MEKSFMDYPLSDEIKKAIQLLHYSEPTQVQKRVFDEVFQKKDLMVKSETGSGKTAAYGIPLCELVNWEDNLPQVLILAPTRELAIQIRQDVFHYGRFKRLKVPVLYGRASFSYQSNELKLKSHIVVGTPGRVLDHLEKGTFITDNIKYLVVDEADEMLRMGFIDQVSSIMEQLPQNRITMLFSATFDGEIQKVAEKYMHQPTLIEIEAEALTVENVEQTCYFTEEKNRDKLLENILIIEHPSRCIIFCNTQEKVDFLVRRLQRRNIPCFGIHGGMEQKDRTRIMERMCNGEVSYLIATDVAARGIDIGNVSHVINYEVPRLRENYVHRIGRTARMGKEGKAITIFEEHQEKRWEELEHYTGSDIVKVEGPLGGVTKTDHEAFLKAMGTRGVKQEKKGADLDAQITKMHIRAGRKEKIRPTDIVGAICSIEGLSGEDIGVIEIQDRETLVDILNDKGRMVCKELQKKNIKGRLRKVSLRT